MIRRPCAYEGGLPCRCVVEGCVCASAAPNAAEGPGAGCSCRDRTCESASWSTCSLGKSLQCAAHKKASCVGDCFAFARTQTSATTQFLGQRNMIQRAPAASHIQSAPRRAARRGSHGPRPPRPSRPGAMCVYRAKREMGLVYSKVKWATWVVGSW